MTVLIIINLSNIIKNFMINIIK